MRFVAALVFTLLLAACGDNDSLSSEAAQQLDMRVDEIRAAAEGDDRSLLEARLAELRRTVGELQSRGEVTEARAREILAAAAEVEALSFAVPTTSTTTTTTTAPPPPPDDDKDDDEDRGKGKDEKKDRDD